MHCQHYTLLPAALLHFTCFSPRVSGEHHFLAAWRMDPGHARELTRRNYDDNAMPPGAGADEDEPFFGAEMDEDDL